MKSINVLITAASRRVALVRNFRMALEKIGGRVITVDFNTFSPALYFGHNHYTVPLVDDPAYLDKIEKIMHKEKISLLVPTIDNELLLWATNRDYFQRKGIVIAVSQPETIVTCNDKYKTYKAFKDLEIPFPRTYLPEELTYNMNFPLFIKPRDGRGSLYSFVVKSKRELDFFLDYVPKPIVQEYLTGKEFTVDAYFDSSGELISFIPRYRLVIRAGVSDRGKTFRNDKLKELILQLGKKIPFFGPINIQGKIFRNEIKFFEVNPRFSGGIQLSTVAGKNFAEYLIREVAGEKLTPELDQYQNNFYMTSYEESIFIDNSGKIHFFYSTNQNILPQSIHLHLEDDN